MIYVILAPTLILSHVFCDLPIRILDFTKILLVIQARLAKSKTKKKIWPALVTRLLTPRSRNSGYGLLLGCRSPLALDAGHEKKLFFNALIFLLKKPWKHRLAVVPTIAIDRAWSN